MPKISVLMSVHNGEPYLPSSVESILRQTLADWELVIIDDASTDNTGSILAEYAQQDTRIVWLTNPMNLGLAESLNIGLKVARGEYIARQDADDISLPSRFEEQVAFMDAHPEIGIAGTWVEIMGDKQGIWSHPINSEEIRCALLFYNPVTHSSVMIRREPFVAAGLGYDRRFVNAEDYALWVRASRHLALGTIPKVLLRYRVHSEQVSRKFEQSQQHTVAEIQLGQLRDLNIDATPDELALHRQIGQRMYLPTRSFILQSEKWLYKLYLANEAQKVYPEPAFCRYLAWRWRAICRAATPLRLWALARFWRSPLSKNIGLKAKMRLSAIYMWEVAVQMLRRLRF